MEKEKKGNIGLTLLFIVMAIGVGAGLYWLFIYEKEEKQVEEPAIEEPELVVLSENDEILRGLIYPSINRGWKYIDVKISNLSRSELMTLAAPNAKEYEPSEENIIDEGVLVPSSIIKGNYLKLFGSNTEYTDGSLRAEEGLVCGLIDKYYEEENSYLIKTECDDEDEYGVETKFHKAEQRGDEIYVYFYVQEYVIKNGDEVYLITPTGEEELVESVDVITESVQKSEAPIYRFTFKKQSDGNYYIYSANWVK